MAILRLLVLKHVVIISEIFTADVFVCDFMVWNRNDILRFGLT